VSVAERRAGIRDCGLVYLVMDDDELRADLAMTRRAAAS
jgi:hypothetical protein